MILLFALLFGQANEVVNPCPVGTVASQGQASSRRPQQSTGELPKLNADVAPIVVKIQLIVSKEGKPCDLRVVNPTHSVYESRALAAVSQWKFQPGRKGKKPIDIATTVEMAFRREDEGTQADFERAMRGLSSGDAKQIDNAIQTLETLSAQADPKADSLLGYILYQGMRVPKDVSRGRQLIERSFAKQDRFALFAMGLLLVEGKALPMDREKGVALIRQAAALEVPQAKQWLQR